MLRRLFLALTGAVIIMCGITACTTAFPTSPKANSYVSPPEGMTPAPLVTDPPVPHPPLPTSIPPLAAVALDTTGFDAPASVLGWEFLDNQTSVVVAIGITSRDWQILAAQLHLDASTDLYQVQMDETTASSLIDIDSLADDIQSHSSAASPVKFTDLYQVYVLRIIDVT